MFWQVPLLIVVSVKWTDLRRSALYYVITNTIFAVFAPAAPKRTGLFITFAHIRNENMSVSKEVKTGLLVSAALVILFVGFYFLKGANLFSNENEFYVIYPNAEGLQSSANVQVDGLNVGRISRTELVNGKGVKISIVLSKKIDVPVGTKATLAAFDLLGTKMIKIDLGKGPGTLPTGSMLEPGKENGVIDNLSGELTPTFKELKTTIASLNNALAGVNHIVDNENQKAIAEAIASIKATANNLSTLSAALASEGGEIKSILHNANSVTGNLAKQNDTIAKMLANFNNISRQLANSPIQKTVADLQGAANQLQGVVHKINNNEGSLGMLVNNKDMYNNLNGSLKSLSELMTDMKAHPSRYINVTIFGKKKN